jgi:hypothetical protein
MMSIRRAIFLAALIGISSLALGKTRNVPQPIDTSAGSLTDPKHMLQVNLDKVVSVGISNQPMEIALNQISAILAIEWGYTEEVDKQTPVSLNVSAPGRDVIKALGQAAKVRFEVVGPTQVRILKARGATARKPATLPPPSKRN